MSAISKQRKGWTYTALPGDLPPHRMDANRARCEAAGMRLLTSSDPERVDGPDGTEIWGKPAKRTRKKGNK